jgi:hypothetical protein
MPIRAAAILGLLIFGGLGAQSQPSTPPATLPSLLKGTTTAALTLEAPLGELFQKDTGKEETSVRGTVSFKDASGGDVVLRDVIVSVRGHTSETECSFPKLKLKVKDGGSLKIGTHCGEEPGETLSKKYGRLTNEKSPFREALAYRLLETLGVPALRSRPARITYLDSSAGAGAAPLVRNGLLLEDDGDAMKRVGGTSEISMENFGDVTRRGAVADASRIAFGEALIANFDWCLKFTAGDKYRCNDPKPLWNILGFDRGGSTALLMKDLDLAGIVVAKHPWFGSIFNPAFVPSTSEAEIEVISQVQRTRSLFTRAELDALRRNFVSRKAAAYEVLDKADVDPAGREIARAHLDAFFKAIQDDSFYRPVVVKRDVQVYADPEKSKEACGAKDTVLVGTPVNVVQQSGPMSQVVILDALWVWGPKNPCAAVQHGSVWISSDAISASYPQ